MQCDCVEVVKLDALQRGELQARSGSDLTLSARRDYHSLTRLSVSCIKQLRLTCIVQSRFLFSRWHSWTPTLTSTTMAGLV